MPHTVTIEPWDVWSHNAFMPIAQIIYAHAKVHREGSAIGDPDAGTFGEWSEFHRDEDLDPGTITEIVMGLEGEAGGRAWYLREVIHVLTLAGYTPEHAADITYDAYDRVNLSVPLED